MSTHEWLSYMSLLTWVVTLSHTWVNRTRSFLETGFWPCTPLLFDLYHYFEQNGYFWLVPEHAPGPSSQVLPGCRVWYPCYFQEAFRAVWVTTHMSSEAVTQMSTYESLLMWVVTCHTHMSHYSGESWHVTHKWVTTHVSHYRVAKTHRMPYL